jgi:hypothetical protein
VLFGGVRHRRGADGDGENRSDPHTGWLSRELNSSRLYTVGQLIEIL